LELLLKRGLSGFSLTQQEQLEEDKGKEGEQKEREGDTRG